MIQIPVNDIKEKSGVINGMCNSDKTALDALKITTPNGFDVLLYQINNNKEHNMYVIYRFCQFAAYFQYSKYAGFSIRFIDLSGNIDKALDAYLSLSELGWEKEHKDKVMQIFHDIKTHPAALAQLVVVDAF